MGAETLALALAVSLCAYTEERHKNARIWNILLLLKKEVVCFYINFMVGLEVLEISVHGERKAHDLCAD